MKLLLISDPFDAFSSTDLIEGKLEAVFAPEKLSKEGLSIVRRASPEDAEAVMEAPAAHDMLVINVGERLPATRLDIFVNFVARFQQAGVPVTVMCLVDHEWTALKLVKGKSRSYICNIGDITKRHVAVKMREMIYERRLEQPDPSALLEQPGVAVLVAPLPDGTRRMIAHEGRRVVPFRGAGAKGNPLPVPHS
jgi:hypothetical protein